MKTVNKVLYLILILIVLVAAWFLVKQNIKPQLTKLVSPSPTPRQEPKTLRKEGYEIKHRITKTDKKSGDLVIQENSDFTITYLISNDQFIVDLKKSPFETTKQKAEGWFIDRGFIADELCSLRITFAASKEIEPNNLSLKDTSPTGCSLSTANP